VAQGEREAREAVGRPDLIAAEAIILRHVLPSILNAALARLLDRRPDLLRLRARADSVYDSGRSAEHGIIYLVSSLLYSRLTDGTPHVFAGRHVLLCLMLALTLLSQFWIMPRMDTLRSQVGDFASVPVDNPARIQFDALHVWSTRVEGAVLLLGLVVAYLTAASSS